MIFDRICYFYILTFNIIRYFYHLLKKFAQRLEHLTASFSTLPKVSEQASLLLRLRFAIIFQSTGKQIFTPNFESEYQKIKLAFE